ncbi:hypothetical protein [Ochrobactrum sp. AN78]|uniref:hypothetical protein n=1 Tax=Ochrobactrum sp. AN78 TaxID=3039853 RepID=UPI0021F7BC1F|nr:MULTISPECIES: hypothetical protein [Brucella/Ochrobactrum group]MCV9908506.1 hypothetical protein [Brucella sp. HL-2]MDH7790473.1 hypothetical protein [Ochrobactrum sp. AN78]
MRLYLGIALVLLPNIAFAESDKDNISYVCDHDNVIEIITSQDDPDRIILNAFGRERTLKRNTSASQNSFVGEGYEISFATSLEKIAVTSDGATLNCNVDAVD